MARGLAISGRWVAGGLAIAVISIFLVSAEEGRTEEPPTLSLTVVDRESSKLIACRIIIERPGSNGEGPFVFGSDAEPSQRYVRPPGFPYFGDHFVCEGKIDRIQLPEPGRYRYLVSHGKEYRSVEGDVELQHGQHREVSVGLERFADLRARGWFAGDFHNHREAADMPLLLRAEDLHIVPVPKIWYHNREEARDWRPAAWDTTRVPRTEDGRYYPWSIEEEQENCLFYFNAAGLPDGKSLSSSTITTCTIAGALQRRGAWLDIDRPTWWDVPVVLTNARVDSVGLICNHFTRTCVLARGNWGWSYMRDQERYPGAKGYADWNFDVYCHILNCGFRIPPSAGSASGVLNNPVGQNRVYVHCGAAFDYRAWWNSFRSGEVFVTNGPLLIPSVQGQLPGHVFIAGAGERLNLEVEVEMASADVISQLEIVKNGETVSTIPVQDTHKKGRIASVPFSRSGWFLLRAITKTEPHLYKCAVTGPYYVEIGEDKQTRSKRSADFFLEWLKAAQKEGVATRWSEDELQQAKAYFGSIKRNANAP